MNTRQVYERVMTALDFRNTGFIGSEFNHHWEASVEEWLKSKMPLLDSDQELDEYMRFLRIRDHEVLVTDWKATVPDRYRRLTRVSVAIQYVSDAKRHCKNKAEKTWPPIVRNCERLTDDKAGYVMKDPFDRPRAEKPYHQLTGNLLRIVTAPLGTVPAGHTVAKGYLNYILQPLPLAVLVDEFGEIAEPTGPEVTDEPLIRRDLETDLNDLCLLEIIPICVRRMLEAKGDPRYQTQLSEKQISNAVAGRPA